MDKYVGEKIKSMKKNKQIVKQNTFTEFLLYTTPNGKVKVEIFLRDETVWLTQAKIAELFDVDRSVITKHLKNIFESRELQEDSVCANFAHTAVDGKTYQTKFYNLDVIISVGYRVNSQRATHFRIWATQVLQDRMLESDFDREVRKLLNGKKKRYKKEE